MSIEMGKLRFVVLAFVVCALAGCLGGEGTDTDTPPGENPDPIATVTREAPPAEKPTEKPTETPGVEAETTANAAPEDVLARFASALANGDRGDALACLDKSTPAGRAVATICESAMILVERTVAFEAAVTKKFGDEAAASLRFLSSGGNMFERLGSLKDQIAAGSVEIDGDRAKVAVEGLPDGTLAMVRKKDRWYVHLAAPSGVATQENEGRFKAERDLFDRTIAEATAALEKSASPKDLRSELDRIEARMVARRLAIQAAAGTGVPRAN